jgi:hypothetical protein
MSKLRIKEGAAVAADFDGSDPPLVEDFLTGNVYSIDSVGGIHLLGGGSGLTHPQVMARIAFAGF